MTWTNRTPNIRFISTGLLRCTLEWVSCLKFFNIPRKFHLILLSYCEKNDFFLGSLWHGHVWDSLTDSRKHAVQLAQIHYEKSVRLYAQAGDAICYLTGQMQRVALAEFLAESMYFVISQCLSQLVTTDNIASRMSLYRQHICPKIETSTILPRLFYRNRRNARTARRQEGGGSR